MNDVTEKSIQEFSRFEFKYILNEGLRNKVEKLIQHFMKYDGYVHAELNNSYLLDLYILIVQVHSIFTKRLMA